MIGLIKRYTHWLHGRWPAGKPERLPAVNEDGSTNVPGLYVVGDLTGIPLLKFSLDTGTKAIRTIKDAQRVRPDDGYDVVIVGGGAGGVAAAVEAANQGMSYVLLETSELFSTIANFPKKKPIYTYPMEMEPEGDLKVSAEVKEELLDELRAQAQAKAIVPTIGRASHIERDGDSLVVQRSDGGSPLRAAAVIVAIGRSGDYRKLGVPGEDRDMVSNRLHDPAAYIGKRTLVVGGGDSACEAAIAIAEANRDADHTSDGPMVTLCYRKAELTRPKPDNVTKVHELATEGILGLRLGQSPKQIEPGTVTLTGASDDEALPTDEVLTLIGREPPLDFFRRSGVRIHGETTLGAKGMLFLFFALISLAYLMKAFGVFGTESWNPTHIARQAAESYPAESDKGLGYTLLASMGNGFGFFIALAYCSAVVGFGIRRIKRRKTPYVTRQTISLMLIQCLPLFILPEILLPWLGHMGAWDSGMWKTIADGLFPEVGYDLNGREYWRTYGFILAWPLFVWNLFTDQPLMWWLAISLFQTFVLIPFLIWRWGKGAYCGWICSCGALAETMGDAHREKMPHGPIWNRLNMIGQVFLVVALAMLILRVAEWTTGAAWLGAINQPLLYNGWKPVVDYLFAGALGTGLYFAYSGRVWCRFACPLAALMHLYTRFSQFRITVNSKKCISCNACTSVCHQGIDVMNFANKGKHMEDPECVRCSACVQTCPTGVLQFGRVNGEDKIIGLDQLVASPVVAREGQDNRLEQSK